MPAGVTIYYSTDGVTPTTSFPVYKGPILLNGAGSYNVKAIANGFINSEVASAAYTNPSGSGQTGLEPSGRVLCHSTDVTISDVSHGTTLYYTADGSTPTTSSTRYTGPIPVSASETIKVVGVLSGLVNSPVVSASYTIGP